MRDWNFWAGSAWRVIGRFLTTPNSHDSFLNSPVMADSNPVQEATASIANLLLDEVTGEKVSKTELK
jgi:hypothetical protein